MTTQTNEYTLNQHDYENDDKSPIEHLLEIGVTGYSNKKTVLKVAMHVIPVGLAVYLLFGSISASEKQLILIFIAGYYVARFITTIGISLAVKWSAKSIETKIKKEYKTEWEKRTIALLDTAIFEQRESGEVLYYWSAVTSIQKFENLLLIIINDSYKIRIPARAFDDQDAFKTFQLNVKNSLSKTKDSSNG